MPIASFADPCRCLLRLRIRPASKIPALTAFTDIDYLLARWNSHPDRRKKPRTLLKNLISLRDCYHARRFSELIEASLLRYQNRAVQTAQVIEELIALAKTFREAANRGESLGLNEDELAFYDALEVNDSAVKVLGDESLRTVARELVESVRKNVGQ